MTPEFILELVERANDRFLDRLEGLNAILVGELAATLGIAGIVIDKYTDLGDGLFWLGAAYLCCAAGLAFGYLWSRPPESPHPIAAIILLEKREDGVASLTQKIGRAWLKYQWLRSLKTTLAGAALVFLTIGTVVSLNEKVVQSSHVGNRNLAPVHGGSRRNLDAPPGGRAAKEIRNHGRAGR